MMQEWLSVKRLVFRKFLLKIILKIYFKDGEHAVRLFEESISLNDEKVDQKANTALLTTLSKLGKKDDMIKALVSD